MPEGETMSHDLEQYTDGSTAFVAGHKQDAWHQLGTVLPEGLTARDVMTFAHLGSWDVRKREIQTTLLSADGVTNTTIEAKYVTVRTNPVSGTEEVVGLATGHAGIVGNTYKPFQNESLTDYLQTMTDESGAFLDTAGSMRGGADVFVTMKLPTTMLVGGIDELDVNIAILNNHTGNRAITGLITPTRIVCANTQRAALGTATASFKIRHTEKAGDRVQQAGEQLGLTWKYVAEFEIEAEKMIQENLSIEAFRKVCDQIWKPPTQTATDRSKTIAANRAQSLTRLFLDADTNANIRSTNWAGYQAVTEYLDHAAPVHGKTTGEKAINRALRSIDGSVVDIKEKAFALLSV
jgi:phage/plasmid-like protein (TIGR03299 family)